MLASLPRRRVLTLLSAAAVAGSTLAGLGAAPAAAATMSGVTLNGYEARLVADINATRAAHGLAPLRVLAGPTDVARGWAWQLAEQATLGHNPALGYQLGRHGCGGWTTIDENVGRAAFNDPDAVYRLYLASPAHLANILDRTVTAIGVGAVQRSVTTWNVLDFVAGCSTAYRSTFRPPQGTVLDRRVLSPGAALATFETGLDERLGVASSGGVRIGAPVVDRPSAADGAARVVLSHTTSTAGAAELVLNDAVDFRNVHTLNLSMAVSDPTGRPVAVTVRATQTFGTTVVLGTVNVSTHAAAVRLPLPAAARLNRNRIELLVRSTSLDAVSRLAAQRVARLAVYNVSVS